MRNNGKIGISVGVSSIIMIFVVLCLTTFGTLSYFTAQSDYKLSMRAKEVTQKFYSADCVFEERLAEIDNYLFLAKESAKMYVQTGDFDNLPCGTVVNSTRTNIVSLGFVRNNTSEEKTQKIFVEFAKMLISLDTKYICKQDENLDNFIEFSIYIDDTHKLDGKVQALDYDNETRSKVVFCKVNSTQEFVEKGLNVWQG